MILKSKLFHMCAYDVKYTEVGNGVNYAFVEDKTHMQYLENTLIIFFEGSNQVTDWIRNFLFGKRPYKDMKIPYRVHRGFLAAWKEVEDIIIQKITEKNSKSEYKWQRIIIVGYSHGGALAAFCHECCWFYRRDAVIEGYGFEAPRIYAGFRVKKALRERWATFTVIRNKNDIVTHCPPAIFGYTHVGTVKKIGKKTSTKDYKWPHCIGAHYPDKVYESLKSEEV